MLLFVLSKILTAQSQEYFKNLKYLQFHDNTGKFHPDSNLFIHSSEAFIFQVQRKLNWKTLKRQNTIILVLLM